MKLVTDDKAWFRETFKDNSGYERNFRRENAGGRQENCFPASCSAFVTRIHIISAETFLCHHTELGWTFHGSAYCQLICEANKQNHFEWARQHLHNNFNDVV